ncbi:MAG: hypothetical protein ACR2MU_02280 [Gaiellaceae bacterium]
MSEAWTKPEREPLPSLEDLPLVPQGYDPERVRASFEAFYQHIARLDSTLQTIEAVDAFGSQARELRAELRNLRAAGWTQQPYGTGYARTESYARPGIPAALPRIFAEVVLLVAVAVFAGVAHLRAPLIVAVMAAAWLLVGLVEWLASRERAAYVRTAVAPAALPPVPEDEPAPRRGFFRRRHRNAIEEEAILLPEEAWELPAESPVEEPVDR